MRSGLPSMVLAAGGPLVGGSTIWLTVLAGLLPVATSTATVHVTRAAVPLVGCVVIRLALVTWHWHTPGITDS